MALVGERVRLQPLDAVGHVGALFAAGHGDGADPALWDHLSYGPFADRAAFGAWLRECAATTDPLFYAVVADELGGPAGMVSFLRIAAEHGSIEIGHVWFGARLQRTPHATEAIALMARHAFEDLGHRRLEWKTNAANARSRAAALRLGFTYEGTFRQHMIVKGANRDTAWFSMLDREWPAARTAFERWLDRANFDATGRQRRGLAQLRGEGDPGAQAAGH